MTTAAAIELYRRQTLRKLTKRLESVDLSIIDAFGGNAYVLYGAAAETHCGAILAPGGAATWSIPQIHDLLAMIGMYGKASKYRIRLRKGYSIWEGEIAVSAGRIALDEAALRAEYAGAELMECVRVDDGVQHDGYPTVKEG